MDGGGGGGTKFFCSFFFSCCNLCMIFFWKLLDLHAIFSSVKLQSRFCAKIKQPRSQGPGAPQVNEPCVRGWKIKIALILKFIQSIRLPNIKLVLLKIIDQNIPFPLT